MSNNETRRVLKAAGQTDPSIGTVKWAPAKSFWIGSLSAIGSIGAPLTIEWGAVLVFLTLTVLTLCAGHSVGMHRLLIHRSFTCPKALEYFLVYLGTLVGMAGPFGMMRQHDLRDWAQRQTRCHDYLCHRRNIWTDYFWQCHCDVALKCAPSIRIEEEIYQDPFYRWLERTWMAQQLPLALILFVMGGWSWIIWGVALRVAVSVTGHWLVGYFAHHDMHDSNNRMSWFVHGASVQGKDVPIAGLISMGESWHNNHHAFPGSAKIGLLPHQPDPGWWVIKALEKWGLASNIVLPETMPRRPTVERLPNSTSGCWVCRFRKRLWARFFQSA